MKNCKWIWNIDTLSRGEKRKLSRELGLVYFTNTPEDLLKIHEMIVPNLVEILHKTGLKFLKPLLDLHIGYNFITQEWDLNILHTESLGYLDFKLPNQISVLQKIFELSNRDLN